MQLASGPGSVSLGWWLDLSEPKFLPLQNGDTNRWLFYLVWVREMAFLRFKC